MSSVLKSPEDYKAGCAEFDEIEPEFVARVNGAPLDKLGAKVGILYQRVVSAYEESDEPDHYAIREWLETDRGSGIVLRVIAYAVSGQKRHDEETSPPDGCHAHFPLARDAIAKWLAKTPEGAGLKERSLMAYVSDALGCLKFAGVIVEKVKSRWGRAPRDRAATEYIVLSLAELDSGTTPAAVPSRYSLRERTLAARAPHASGSSLEQQRRDYAHEDAAMCAEEKFKTKVALRELKNEIRFADLHWAEQTKCRAAAESRKVAPTTEPQPKPPERRNPTPAATRQPKPPEPNTNLRPVPKQPKPPLTSARPDVKQAAFDDAIGDVLAQIVRGEMTIALAESRGLIPKNWRRDFDDGIPF